MRVSSCTTRLKNVPLGATDSHSSCLFHARYCKCIIEDEDVDLMDCGALKTTACNAYSDVKKCCPECADSFIDLLGCAVEWQDIQCPDLIGNGTLTSSCAVASQDLAVESQDSDLAVEESQDVQCPDSIGGGTRVLRCSGGTVPFRGIMMVATGILTLGLVVY